MDPLVPQELQEAPADRDSKAYVDQAESLVHQVLPAPQDCQDPVVLLGTVDQLDLVDQQGLLVAKGRVVLLGHADSLALKDLQVSADITCIVAENV